MPAASSRARSHAGDGPISTPVNTRAMYRGHRSGASTRRVTCSSTDPCPVAAGSSVTGGQSGAPVTADTSRAMPHTPSRSGRFAESSNSRIVSDSGRTSASGVPGGRSVSSTMIPSWSSPSSSSRSERIIPRLSMPRSFATLRARPSGISAPGSATATVWPVATFGAPQTICCSTSRADVDAAEPEPVGVRVLHRLDDLPHPVVREVAVGVGNASAMDRLHLDAGRHQPL